MKSIPVPDITLTALPETALTVQFNIKSTTLPIRDYTLSNLDKTFKGAWDIYL